MDVIEKKGEHLQVLILFWSTSRQRLTKLICAIHFQVLIYQQVP